MNFSYDTDLFKFDDDEMEGDDQPVDKGDSNSLGILFSSTNYYSARKSWTPAIQDRRKDFTPTPANKSQKAKPRPFRSEGHPKAKTKPPDQGNSTKWINMNANPIRLFEPRDDSPSKYQAIECVKSSSESSDGEDPLVTPVHPNQLKRTNRDTALHSKGSEPRRRADSSKNFKNIRIRRFPVISKQTGDEEEVKIDRIDSPTRKPCLSARNLNIPEPVVPSLREKPSNSPFESPQNSPCYDNDDDCCTPERPHWVLPPSDDEREALANTILEVESPSRPSPSPKARRPVKSVKSVKIKPWIPPRESETGIQALESPSKSKSSPPPSPYVLSSNLVSISPLLPVPASDSDISAHISEDASTQSSGMSELLARTPIAEWARNRDNLDTMAMDISEFDSPKKSERLMAYSEANSEHWTVGNRRRKKRGLVKQMETIVDRYDSSVKMFTHDLKNKKFEEESALPLLVLGIAGRDARLLWSICHDLKAACQRLVVFQPHYQGEITVGATLRLYQPWTEINVAGIGSPMIIGTDFYKMIEKPRDLHPGTTKEYINHLMLTNPSKNVKIQTIPFGDLKHVFFDLIPYVIKNQHKISVQTGRYQGDADLDVVVQNTWPTDEGHLVLFKDSDGTFGGLNVPLSANESLQQVVLCPGRHIKFKRLGINAKITRFKDSAVFSVLGVYGSKQVLYFNFGLRVDTEWSAESALEIPFGRMDCQTKFIHEIQQVDSSDDLRVAVECRILSRSMNFIKVVDSLGARMKVELVSRPGSSRQNFTDLTPRKSVRLNFLRIHNETPILDEFSTVQLSSTEIG